MNDAILAFEDGSFYQGKAFGAKKTTVGEAIFNTSMMGYQELLTDPSNYKLLLMMTFVETGCYGINEKDVESDGIKVSGMVVAQETRIPSNWRSQMSLHEYLEKNNIPGISDVDTRAITKKLRLNGALKACLSTEGISPEKAIQLAKDWAGLEGVDYIKEVTCKKPYYFDPKKFDIIPFKLGGVHINVKERRTPLFKCAAIDYGAKLSILKSLAYSGFDVTVFPATASAEEIMEFGPECLFLSNGPGDPSATTYAHKTVAKLIQHYPTFGVCFGHQVITHSIGAKTYKLKFGHHGGNHPVKNLETEKINITAQNHGFAADAKSIENAGGIVTEINLNDNTVEGLRHKDLPLFSVQYHPESAPGPTDASYVFDNFYDMVKKTLDK